MRPHLYKKHKGGPATRRVRCPIHNATVQYPQ
jgi:hypothetical protein